jgi:hypothetical protein
VLLLPCVSSTNHVAKGKLAGLRLCTAKFPAQQNLALWSIPQDCKKSNKQINPIEYLEPQNQKDAWEVFLYDDNECHPQHPSSSSSTEKKRFTW